MLKVAVLLFLVSILLGTSLGFIKVDPKTQNFVDDNGRSIIFHGVNVVYKPSPMYPPILAPASAFDPWVSFTETDMNNLKNWGFNSVRLYVSWKAVQPTREGPYNYQYLNTIKGIIQNMKKYGLYALGSFVSFSIFSSDQ